MPGDRFQFTSDDLDRFRRASHDRNPLHESPEYARRTPFGERVVFGVLTALAGLSRIEPPEGRMLETLRLEFPHPAFEGVPCRAELRSSDEAGANAGVFDGRRPVCRLRATWQPRRAAPVEPAPSTPAAPRSAAAVHAADDLRPGLTRKGTWAPDARAFEELREALGPAAHAYPASQLAALLWASFFVGMEWPWRDALFSNARFRFAESAPEEAGPLDYEAEIRGFDPRFRTLSIAARLVRADVPLAAVDIQAFLRSEPAEDSRVDAWSARPQATRPIGRHALVVGASRGLGASLAYGLAREGWSVAASYQRSEADAEALVDRARSCAGDLVALRGDAADPADWAALRERLGEGGRELDLLVCNASPALRSLWIEPECVERIADYVRASIAMVAAPLATFLDDVARREGCVVLVSSQAVSEPPSDWPHYVAAKQAVEGLVHTAAREYPKVRFLVVRPPRLRTHFADSPLARATALHPDVVSVAVLASLTGELPQGRVEVLDRFPDLPPSERGS